MIFALLLLLLGCSNQVSAQDICKDVPNDAAFCREQKALGNCELLQETNKCLLTCGFCASGAIQCEDKLLDKRFTCLQLVLWDMCEKDFMKGYCQVSCNTCLDNVKPKDPNAPTPAPKLTFTSMYSNAFHIRSGRIFTPEGREFVIRGVNVPISTHYDQVVKDEVFSSISSIGFNLVRFEWSNKLPVAKLRTVLQKLVEHNLVPMLAISSLRADGSAIEKELDPMLIFIRQIAWAIAPYQRKMIVNVANKWPAGWDDASNQLWYDSYHKKIRVLRDAGIAHLLVVDASGYGTAVNGTVLKLNWAHHIFVADPLKNMAFSVHMFETFASSAAVESTIRAAYEKELPLVIGEFSARARRGPVCDDLPLDTLFNLCEDRQNAVGRKTGWIAWSWKGNGLRTSYMDMIACSVNTNCNLFRTLDCSADDNWAASALQDFGADWGQIVFKRAKDEGVKFNDVNRPLGKGDVAAVPPRNDFLLAPPLQPEPVLTPAGEAGISLGVLFLLAGCCLLHPGVRKKLKEWKAKWDQHREREHILKLARRERARANRIHALKEREFEPGSNQVFRAKPGDAGDSAAEPLVPQLKLPNTSGPLTSPRSLPKSDKHAPDGTKRFGTLTDADYMHYNVTDRTNTTGRTTSRNNSRRGSRTHSAHISLNQPDRSSDSDFDLSDEFNTERKESIDIISPTSTARSDADGRFFLGVRSPPISDRSDRDFKIHPEARLGDSLKIHPAPVEEGETHTSTAIKIHPAPEQEEGSHNYDKVHPAPAEGQQEGRYDPKPPS